MRGAILRQLRCVTYRNLSRTVCCMSAVPINSSNVKRPRQSQQGLLKIGTPSFTRHWIHTSPKLRGKVVPFVLSDIGEGIREVVVKEWFVEEGDHVSQFDQICEVQSDKASVTITSRYDGIVKKRHYNVDDTALVGDALVDIELSEGAHDSVAHDQVDNVTGENLTSQVQSDLLSSEPDSSSDEDPYNMKTDVKVLATPAVRRIAAENKINLRDVIGTGKDGRVLKEDVLAYLSQGQRNVPTSTPTPTPTGSFKAQQPASTTATSHTSTIKTPSDQKPVSSKKDEVITLRGIRKAMSQSMNDALKIPHFGYCDEIDMTALVKLRKELKGSPLVGKVPFSYMPVILKACSLALTEFPILNSSLKSADQIVIKAAHNIGFAMDSPDGLIVPNIKNVQNLSILDIAEEMYRLINLGENGKLGMNDLSDGTFTISNIGSIGGTYAKPVILPPQVAIGALGKIQALPRFDSDDNLVKAHIMKVSWSADHRVIEGAQMARFSNLWKSYLENPATLILKMR